MSVVTKEEREKQYKEVFALFDKNKDGVITKAELGEAMALLGEKASEAELQEILDALDLDQNGVIDYDEFVEMMNCQTENINIEAGQLGAFKAFDRDGNGVISASELKEVLSNLGQEFTDDQIADMIREADTDGDGQINYHEFIATMSAKRK